jgi:hypothetical protein
MLMCCDVTNVFQGKEGLVNAVMFEYRQYNICILINILSLLCIFCSGKSAGTPGTGRYSCGR